MLEKIAQRGCGESTLGGTQNPAGNRPEQPTVVDHVLSRAGWTR